MKKIILLVLTMFVVSTINNLSAQSFNKGQTDINIGIGLGNTIITSGATNVLPPLSLSVEYGITDDISVGGYFGITGASYSYSGWENCGKGSDQYYIDTYKWSFYIIGARGAYHFGHFIKVDKLDVYAGLMLGDDIAHFSYSTTSTCSDHIGFISSSTYGGFVFSIYAGARYRFTDHFGAFLELGYGITYLNIGLNIKL